MTIDESFERLTAADIASEPRPVAPFDAVVGRAHTKRAPGVRVRLWVRGHVLALTAGLLLVAGSATAAVAGFTSEPRQREATVVQFDPSDSAATADLAGVPLPPEVGDRNWSVLSADGHLLKVPDGQTRLTKVQGDATSGVTVKSAVERRPEESAAAVRGAGSIRLNYQADASYEGQPYIVEVLQPSVEDAARGIEGPGDRTVVDGVTAYVANSAPNKSWATTFAVDGLFVSVSSNTSSEARLAVARGLGLIPAR